MAHYCSRLHTYIVFTSFETACTFNVNIFLNLVFHEIFHQPFLHTPPMFHILTMKCHKFLKLVSAIFHYFWKKQCTSWLISTKYFEKNLTYSCFIVPLFHEHLFSPELPCAARLLKTSCFEKITVCVIETMLVTLRLVQMNSAWREA